MIVEGEAHCEHAFVAFFFSSRRRHTRLTCDWSSDVCSSDLRRQSKWSSPGPSDASPPIPTTRRIQALVRQLSTAGLSGKNGGSARWKYRAIDARNGSYIPRSSRSLDRKSVV